MSLDWSTTKCEPSMPKDESDEVLRNTLVMSMLAIGQRGITEKNLDEVVLRLTVLEKLGGACRSRYTEGGDYVPIYFTREEVKRWVGLSTNVTDESRASFTKRMINGIERDLNYARRKAEEEREATEQATQPELQTV